MGTQYRQGDILFEKVENKSNEFFQLDETNIVAHGEISGHKHVLSQPAQFYTRVQQQRGSHEGDNRIGYIMTECDAVVTHDEHAPMHLKKGTYVVTQQREHVQEAANLNRYVAPVVKRVED